LVEPYKSKFCPTGASNSDIAEQSSEKIYEMFLNYLQQDDIGADMARKFTQWVDVRRYANHKSGRKYKNNPQKSQRSPD